MRKFRNIAELSFTAKTNHQPLSRPHPLFHIGRGVNCEAATTHLNRSPSRASRHSTGNLQPL